MNPYFPHLLSEIQVGKQTYKNRVVNAPRGGIWDEEPGVYDTDIEQLTDADAKCEGGVAAYYIGETAVSASGGRGANEFYGFEDFSEPHMRRYVQYCDRIHKYGAKALVELSHMGLAKPESEEGAPAVGPSEMINSYGAKVEALSEEGIKEVAEEFAKAACFMKKAGYDGVLIHCGHGWLPHQFLSVRWNKREDQYGGSIENRSRFTVDVLQAMRKACGEDFILECRISGDEHLEDGYDMQTIVDYCKQIEPYCDMIHVSAGVYYKPMETKMMSTLYDAHGCNMDAAYAIKQAVEIPVAVVGGINDPADAERFIEEGKCDIVVLCRQLQADPDFVSKAATGRACEIRKCLRCMRCYPGPFEEAFEELGGEFPEGCSVNPYLLHFDMRHPKQADESKKVLVIGGGVGGMQAALTASERGHQVTLVEKSGRLGGILNFAENDTDKYDLKGLAEAMSCEVRSRNIKVFLNKEADSDMVKDNDVVICAIGSSTLIPPIPGLEDATEALAAYKIDAKIGDEVIILGGGLVGSETAIHLAKQGRKVTIVEMRDALAPDAYRLHKHKVRQIIEAMDITVMTEAKCLFVKDNKVVVETAQGEKTLSADTVIAALGMKANPTDEIKALAESLDKEYYEIGDCKRARKIFDAVEEGFLTAYAL